jgi:hypothetical protein
VKNQVLLSKSKNPVETFQKATAFATPFGWLLLIGVITSFAQDGVAQAASSWTQSRPSWAAPTQSSSTSSKHSYAAREESEITPYSPGSHNVSVDIGQVFLMGDLSKYTDNIGFRARYNYGVSELFAFDGSIGYSSHSDDEFTLTTLLAGMRMNLSWYDKVIPYAAFGMGFYRPSYKIGATNSLSPVLFGLHLGPGVDLVISKQVFFGAGLTFHNMFGTTRVTQQGAYDVGGTFTAFLLRTGMTF